MVTADLHLHTTNSDGTLTLETLPGAADEAGVEAVAVTDHDRLHPTLDAPVSTVDGLTVVHGIELRVETEGGQRVDLLGYGARRTDDLTALTEHLQADRVERAREMVDCIERNEGVDLDVAFEPGVGRPHIARAIAESSDEYDFDDAFADLIGDDCDCYVARDIPTAAEGLAVLREACGVVGIAHPLRYRDPDPALALAPEVDAIELHYPYGREVDTTPVERAIEDHDLLVAGGSDAHGTELGLAGLDEAEFGRFRDRLAT